MAVFSSKKTLTKVICLLIILALGLAGCGKKVTEPLTKDNLTGKRLAVMAGYSSDYLMSKSPYNFDIYRYDTYADMQMALRFHRVDAIAMESDEAHVICRLKPIYKVGLVVQDNVEYAYMFNSDRPELRKQFNQFIKEFKQTAEYADLLKRWKQPPTNPGRLKRLKTR
jgi:ABC-type amino acid transport substrate-binding protein